VNSGLLKSEMNAKVCEQTGCRWQKDYDEDVALYVSGLAQNVHSMVS
jgi:hypothetical protein